MNHLHSLVLAITLLVGSVSVATAQDYDKGVAAYNAGDYQTALLYFKDIADGSPYAYGYWIEQDCDVLLKNSCFLVPIGTNGPAEYFLGLMYENGQGVLQHYAEAVKWHRLGAEQGYAPAQNNLAFMYQLGEGVLESNVMAHMWFNIASVNGAPKSGEWRDELAGQMTNADISKAQEMARECLSSNYQNCGE
tara:strand:- start:2081 stop:2656 length:576 start_codon:yes stop_codon:yes gene_type:complete